MPQSLPHHSTPPWQGKHGDLAMRQPVNGRSCGGRSGKPKKTIKAGMGTPKRTKHEYTLDTTLIFP
jgi:hypothetical protein